MAQARQKLVESRWKWLEKCFFDKKYYLSQYPDVEMSGLAPFGHFIHHGMCEHRSPTPDFDPQFYLSKNPKAHDHPWGAFGHFALTGAAKKKNPNSRFNPDFYRLQVPSLNGMTPQEHFLRRGWKDKIPCGPDYADTDYLPAPSPGSPRIPENTAVGVIIPCYRGLEETRACIESVLKSVNKVAHEILVLDDCSPEKELSEYLASLDGKDNITVLKNEENLGFVGTVNRGMEYFQGKDVLLLNSDTEVSGDWLDRMAAQAHGEDKISSVTPYSNNATIASYPSMEGSRTIMDGLTPEQMDAYFRSVNFGRGFEIPTAIGFCMYIRRDSLDEVGLFDRETFGKGYGEENDFCMRAAQNGWKHLLAADTYVFHAGEVSFATDSEKGKASGLGIIKEKYPDYDRIIHSHIALDPGKPYRFCATAARWKKEDRPVVVSISHAMGGGTDTYIERVFKYMRGRARFLELKPASPEAKDGKMILKSMDRDDPAELCLDAGKDFPFLVKVLKSFGVTHVHINHLFNLNLDVVQLIKFLDVPFYFTVHDYFTICPYFFLTPGETRYCNEPDPAGCNQCLQKMPGCAAPDIIWWRKSFDWLYREAAAVICPSADVLNRVAKYQPREKLVAALHSSIGEKVPPAPRPPKPAQGKKLKIGILGMLSKRKGAKIVAAVAKLAQKHNLPLEFHIIGKALDLKAAGKDVLKETGRYKEKELPEIIKKVAPDVMWFPAIWPETFSYTLSEAMEQELPVVVTNLGAFVERVDGRAWTWMLDWDMKPKDIAAFFEGIRKENFATGRAPEPVKTKQAASTPDFYDRGYLQDRASSIAGTNEISIAAIIHTNDIGAPDPCAYIRTVLPLTHPEAGKGLDLNIVTTDKFFELDSGILALHRTAVPEVTMARRVIAHCKAKGIKIMYDLDDDLLAIPKNHSDFNYYIHSRLAVMEFLLHADLVTTSTKSLAQSLEQLSENVVVVPNGLDERVWRKDRNCGEKQGDTVSILYMGTMTHERDLALVLPVMEKLKNKYREKVRFDIVGVTPNKFKAGYCRFVKIPAKATKAYPAFVSWLLSKNIWDIGLCPLEDTPFNSGKSGIKFMDYAAMGMAAVCSDVPAYSIVKNNETGMVVANNPRYWAEALEELVENQDKLEKLKKNAARELAARHSLSVQAEFRQGLIHRLAGR